MSDIEAPNQTDEKAEALSYLTDEDLDRLIEIWSFGFPSTDADGVRQEAPEAVLGENSDILVVRDDLGRIASTMIVNVEPGRDKIRGRIDDVATHPDLLRQGYASKVLLFSLDWFREHGASRVYLSSSDEREAAHGLYRKHGFSIHETNEFQLDLQPRS